MDNSAGSNVKLSTTRRRLLGGFTGISLAEMMRARAVAQNGGLDPSCPPDISFACNPPKRQIALIGSPSLNTVLSAQDLQAVAKALTTQIQNDFGPVWKLDAEVVAKTSVTGDEWRVQIYDPCKNPQGYLGNGHGRFLPNPCQFVVHGWVAYTGDTSWSHAASHECLELLANPYLQRFKCLPSPPPSTGDVLYNMEVCDPCPIPDPSYRIDNWVVADFVRPEYYDPTNLNKPGVIYNHLKTIQAPLQPVLGGYQNFVSLDMKTWTTTTWTSNGFYSETLADPTAIDKSHCFTPGAGTAPPTDCAY